MLARPPAAPGRLLHPGGGGEPGPGVDRGVPGLPHQLRHEHRLLVQNLPLVPELGPGHVVGLALVVPRHLRPGHLLVLGEEVSAVPGLLELRLPHHRLLVAAPHEGRHAGGQELLHAAVEDVIAVPGDLAALPEVI